MKIRSDMVDRTDWQRVKAMSDEEVEANARSDANNPPSLDGPVPQGRMARAQVIRRALRLTQEEFSARYHIPLGTLRDWEQHRSEPDQAARAYLKVIAKHPDFVATALADGKPAAAAE